MHICCVYDDDSKISPKCHGCVFEETTLSITSLVFSRLSEFVHSYFTASVWCSCPKGTLVLHTTVTSSSPLIDTCTCIGFFSSSSSSDNRRLRRFVRPARRDAFSATASDAYPGREYAEVKVVGPAVAADDVVVVGVVVASVIVPSVGSAKSAIKRDDDNARKAQRSAFDRINLLFAT